MGQALYRFIRCVEEDFNKVEEVLAASQNENEDADDEVAIAEGVFSKASI